MSDPTIATRRQTVLSPWVTLTERDVRFSGASETPQLYHSFVVADYVSLLAETDDGRIVVVEQFRPALERRTIELPGGLLDDGEDPATCAQRELAEETGFATATPPQLIGNLIADSARLENRVWCFHAKPVGAQAGWQPEPGVEPRLVTKQQLKDMVTNGTFDHAPHVAILGMAILRGLF
ncbi:MAG: hydrolase [Rhodospirillales bacterium]|jgi:ADP-ribose pyrophosphatase|nr:hydrolase [Rhodospirillales bacterium]